MLARLARRLGFGHQQENEQGRSCDLAHRRSQGSYASLGWVYDRWVLIEPGIVSKLHNLAIEGTWRCTRPMRRQLLRNCESHPVFWARGQTAHRVDCAGGECNEGPSRRDRCFGDRRYRRIGPV